ncbi:MAG TPA: hypothetical protein PLH97_07365, partial [Verrucomicrobiota bacterium]|nr:hypothetical protein [Verrucomicrobiota bacterium]
MTQPENATTSAAASLEEIQRGWHDLQTRVAQLEAERDALRQETKSLRSLLERAIEHRQKSHAELVLLLTTLVGKLPLNDVGVLVSRLVEHNAGVGEISAALIKGKVDAPLPQPDVLKALDQTKRHLNETIKALVDELLKLDTPLDRSLLETVAADPESFFSPTVLRATRAYVKGQLPRERVVREFGESALVFFNDMTTDPKLNPRPKPEEIVLTFKSDFESLLQQNAQAANGKQKELADLYRKVQESKSSSEQARLQRNAFQKLSFTLELLHYYENQNTEAPDTVFAQRLPVLIEQLVLGGGAETLDEKQIVQAEELLADIINPDHRLMVINNVGKAGGLARTLKYVLLFRNERIPDQHETIQDFVKHLIQPQQAPAPKTLAAILRLAAPAMQKPLVRAIMATDRLRRDEADQLGRAVAKELQLTDFEEEIKQEVSVPPEVERQLAWEKIKDMIA